MSFSEPFCAGSYWSYVRGCKCDDCLAASARYQRERRAKKRPPDRSPAPPPDRDRAACHGMDPALWFPQSPNPGRGGNYRATDVTGPARKVCRCCGIRTDCLKYAVENGEEHGVWGGLTEHQLRQLRGRWGRYGRPDWSGERLLAEWREEQARLTGMKQARKVRSDKGKARHSSDELSARERRARTDDALRIAKRIEAERMAG